MELAVKMMRRHISAEEESRGPRKRLATFLRQILLSPLAALRLSRGKRLLIVAISYGLGVPGILLLFPIVYNGATMLLPIISASFLFRYRGLLITVVLNAVIISLLYFFLLPDIVTIQVFM